MGRAVLLCSSGVRKCKDALRVSCSSLSCPDLHTIDLLPAHRPNETHVPADLPMTECIIQDLVSTTSSERD